VLPLIEPDDLVNTQDLYPAMTVPHATVLSSSIEETSLKSMTSESSRSVQKGRKPDRTGYGFSAQDWYQPLNQSPSAWTMIRHLLAGWLGKGVSRWLGRFDGIELPAHTKEMPNVSEEALQRVIKAQPVYASISHEKVLWSPAVGPNQPKAVTPLSPPDSAFDSLLDRKQRNDQAQRELNTMIQRYFDENH
jgi:hypothetical protein